MGRSWIYSWNKKGWEKKTQDVQFGEGELRYAASDNFTRRGVSAGDTLFIVNVRGGSLYLGGKIEVAEVLPREDAAHRLGLHPQQLWRKAGECVLADRYQLDAFRPNLRVDESLLKDLQLISGDRNTTVPKMDEGAVDEQTFRALRELAPGEDMKLRRLLA